MERSRRYCVSAAQAGPLVVEGLDLAEFLLFPVAIEHTNCIDVFLKFLLKFYIIISQHTSLTVPQVTTT